MAVDNICSYCRQPLDTRMQPSWFFGPDYEVHEECGKHIARKVALVQPQEVTS